ncbi:MAG: hypothetical protein ACK46E_22925 [Pseudanabaena sp.]
MACIDGLTGFPAAIETVFPKPRTNSASSIWSEIL